MLLLQVVPEMGNRWVFLWANISGIHDCLAEIMVSGLQIIDEVLKKKHKKLKCWPIKYFYDLFSLTSNSTAESSLNIQ